MPTKTNDYYAPPNDTLSKHSSKSHARLRRAEKSRKLNYSKCSKCRKDKKACIFDPGDLKCQRCTQKNAECSARSKLDRRKNSGQGSGNGKSPLQTDHGRPASSPPYRHMPDHLVPAETLTIGAECSRQPAAREHPATPLTSETTTYLNVPSLHQPNHLSGYPTPGPLDHIPQCHPIPDMVPLIATPPDSINMHMAEDRRTHVATNGDQLHLDPIENDHGHGLSRENGTDRGRLWACPYYKLDPVEHYRCLGKYQLKRFFDVKQHLMRCHTVKDESRFCFRCRKRFESQELRGVHVRDGSCQSASRSRSEPLSMKEFYSLKPQYVGDDQSKWYQLWNELFPGSEPPKSAFVKDGLAEPFALIRENLQKGLNSQLGRILSTNQIHFTEAEISLLSRNILDAVMNPTSLGRPYVGEERGNYG